MTNASVTALVQDFYNHLPFNAAATVESARRDLERTDQIAIYPPLAHVLKRAGRVWIIDVGCGTGWFVNTAARYYRVRALGVDLCLPALKLACQVSASVGLRKRVDFVQADLFDLSLRRKFFLVNSIGVLHHTYDCHKALASIARLVDDNGYLHVGLYHAYGRAPFLDMFKGFRDELAATSGLQARAAIEEQAFQLYRELDKRGMDEQALRSWFRDQVLHPHETQHTLQEVCGWLVELGFEPLSTSINRFAPVSDWGAVFKQEPQWREISYQRNVVDRLYFPGFFAVLAKKAAVTGLRNNARITASTSGKGSAWHGHPACH